ncbi:Hypothetical predicted protein, partial [Podarcis lilfordi]
MLGPAVSLLRTTGDIAGLSIFTPYVLFPKLWLLDVFACSPLHNVLSGMLTFLDEKNATAFVYTTQKEISGHGGVLLSVQIIGKVIEQSGNSGQQQDSGQKDFGEQSGKAKEFSD